MKQDVLGLQFDNVTMDEAVARAEELLEAPGASIVVTPNAEIGYEALHDAQFRALLNGADLVLPDGAGVVLAAKLRKTPLKQKVAGVDFADRLLGVLAEMGKTLYLLGRQAGHCGAGRAEDGGTASGPANLRDGGRLFQGRGTCDREDQRGEADVLFVCVGAPKQEIFMHAHRDELDVRLMAGLGGSLDAFAGTVKRAPKWMIRCNLEWLYRLIKEPKRFGRMMRLPKYLWAALTVRSKG